MTTYYVGVGGNNANNGTTWALRKLTLNGAENIPVVAGDIVYVGPGAYREELTCDVSGAAGTPITYIGDVTGEHTDGVGGIVRITGSDNDQTAVRNYGIDGSDESYRTFRGFALDTVANTLIYGGADSHSNWIIEDCNLQTASNYITADGANQANWTIRRCVSIPYYGASTCRFNHAAAVDNTNHLIENCMMLGGGIGINTVRVGGIIVKNCVFIGNQYGVRVQTALTAGQTVTVNNCIIYGGQYGVTATALGEIVENYNSVNAGTARQNVGVGANSNTYPPIFNMPLLQDGFRFPWTFGELSKWSALARITGTGEATDDLFGLTRPVTASKKSWGAIQATGAAREITTVDAGTASVKLPDAGEQFLMRCCVTAVPTTFSIKVYREADYAGTNPQMIIRQAGQADNTTTDAGAAATWNLLSATFTPAADPEWVDIFIRSSNTAVAGNYDTFFDTVVVS
jgi:hypothetical protein